MGCSSCGTGSCAATPKGCNSNGGCASGGCNKLNTYDWFSGMNRPDVPEYESIYEVRFKNTRKLFYRNVNNLSVITGDFVVVESDRGYDVGQISLSGVLAELQMRKKGIDKWSDKVRRIYRRATKEDISRLQKARTREKETLIRTRQIIIDLRLDMKLSEVEFQGDNSKAIFYYIADQRVDFRELIKVLANEFRIRVEMKQIGLRHESGLVGGVGSCGRELCCSTWLTDFKSVSTAAARYQNLSLNPMKISGQCGRLKCCLNYELETYMDALQDIPKAETLETEVGLAILQKTDIFKKKMWFSYQGESAWIPLTVDQVDSIITMNAEGKKPASLSAVEQKKQQEEVELAEEEVDFVDVVGQAILREDKRKKKKKSRKKGRGPDGKTGARQSDGNKRGNRSAEKPQSRRNQSGRQGDPAKGEGTKTGPAAKKNEGEGADNNRDRNRSGARDKPRGRGKGKRQGQKGQQNKGEQNQRKTQGGAPNKPRNPRGDQQEGQKNQQKGKQRRKPEAQNRKPDQVGSGSRKPRQNAPGGEQKGNKSPNEKGGNPAQASKPQNNGGNPKQGAPDSNPKEKNPNNGGAKPANSAPGSKGTNPAPVKPSTPPTE